MRHRLTLAARDDLKRIWRYSMETWGCEQAVRYREKMKQPIQVICKSPGRARARDDIRVGYRAFKAGRRLMFFSGGKRVDRNSSHPS